MREEHARQTHDNDFTTTHVNEAIDVTRIHSCAGTLTRDGLLLERPFRGTTSLHFYLSYDWELLIVTWRSVISPQRHLIFR